MVKLHISLSALVIISEKPVLDELAKSGPRVRRERPKAARL
jgi:hypothetical protein